MKKIMIAAAVVAAATLVATFAFMPRSVATQGEQHERKGPRAVPPIRSDVPGVEIENPRLEGDGGSVLAYDVVNRTDRAIVQFASGALKKRRIVTGDNFISHSPTGDLMPGAKVTCHISADDAQDGAVLVVGAAAFDDGTEVGPPEHKALLKALRDDFERVHGARLSERGSN